MSKPDYGKYARMELWTLSDAAYLLADEKPKRLVELVKQAKSERAGIAGEIYDALKNAIDLKRLDHIKSRTGEIGNRRVRPAECIVWARSRRYEVPKKLGDAVEKNEALATDGTTRSRTRDVSRSQQQENKIIETIRALRYDPEALPVNRGGKSGVKASVRQELRYSTTVFDKAWERLRKQGAIRDASGN